MESVIRTYTAGRVCFVALEEKRHKNTFTSRLVSELKQAFSRIHEDPEIYVVVVHGFDNYFCCGGTKDELSEMCKGMRGGKEASKAFEFTNLGVHDLFLRCDVPVIAAMQGHAIGGGLALGCFADVLVMSRQCIYAANFMKYGFTPGMGATYILPRKFGTVLGTEMLLTAGSYYGGDLQARGATARIVDKDDVIPTAAHLARELADKPLLSLKELKKTLTYEIRRDLPAAIERELEMHRATFAQPEVLERIEKTFGN